MDVRHGEHREGGRRGRARRFGAAVVCVAAGVSWLLAGAAAADPCAVSDNGSGTVTLPPIGCEYLSPSEVHEIINGLPSGTTIEFDVAHKDFICGRGQSYYAGTCSVLIPPGACETNGGTLGGMVDCFDSTAEIHVTGTGTLAGFERTLLVPLAVEVHTAPRTPGDVVQSFDADLFNMQGEITGDPDFDLLQIVAGDNQGLPSPGHTKLMRLGAPGSDFSVASHFDVGYQISFVGATGSVLDGLSGTTSGTVKMQADPLMNLVPGLTGGWLVGAAVVIVGVGLLFLMSRRGVAKSA